MKKFMIILGLSILSPAAKAAVTENQVLDALNAEENWVENEALGFTFFGVSTSPDQESTLLVDLYWDHELSRAPAFLTCEIPGYALPEDAMLDGEILKPEFVEAVRPCILDEVADFLEILNS